MRHNGRMQWLWLSIAIVAVSTFAWKVDSVSLIWFEILLVVTGVGFGGLPGVDTAYYATQFGYAKGDDNNVRALLEQMQGQQNRRAAMVSTLVAVRSPQDPEPLIAVGRVVGEIAPERRGSHGFGFDPVMFIPEFGQTFAELPPEVKNANSHRGRAAQQMLALMRERWLPDASKM